MTTDSTATASTATTAPAPTDTATPASDTAQNTQASPPVDWQARYRALEADHTRKSTELAALKRAADVPDEDEDEEQEPPIQPRKRGRNLAAELEAERARRENAEWVIASSVYGQEVIEAYSASADLLSAAETAADYVAAFEAYHQRRSAGMTPAQAAAPVPAAPAREQAVTPRVDSNQSDLLPDEVAIAEAKRTKDMPGYIRRLFGAAGIE